MLRERNEKIISQWPFKIAVGPGDKPIFEIVHQGKPQLFTPEQILAKIFDHLKSMAEAHLKESNAIVQDVVVAVPAWFNDAQRQVLNPIWDFV